MFFYCGFVIALEAPAQASIANLFKPTFTPPKDEATLAPHRRSTGYKLSELEPQVGQKIPGSQNTALPIGLQLGAILGHKLEQVWQSKSRKSRPKHLPRRIREPGPTQTPKMAPKWRPQPPKMILQTPHFGSIVVSILKIVQ